MPTDNHKNSLFKWLGKYPLIISTICYAFITAIYAIATDGVLRDDAYIFFTYANNLVSTGELAFLPGHPSYGVTSILWTLLLACGTLIISNTIIVAKILGIILGSIGVTLWFRWIFYGLNVRNIILPIILAALLPTIGAGRMVTGMETSLACFLSGLIINMTSYSGRWQSMTIGLVCGAFLMVRPEMAVMVPIILMALVWKKQIRQAILFVSSCLAIAGWWTLWLYYSTGHFLPPTRVGKLSVFLPESLGITYSEFQSGSLIERICWAMQSFKNFINTAVSSQFLILLIIGIFIIVLLSLKKIERRQFKYLILPFIIVVALLIMYSFLFPLMQLRYFVWIVPALFATGLAGLRLRLSPRHYKLLNIMAVTVLLIVLPYAVSHRIQATNIQQIRREVAREIKNSTPVDARIALEPIGEIGYYSNRYIIDMGGLIDITIQPYLANGYNDTDKIWRCLVDYEATHLVTYDHDGFLGRLPKVFPDRFQLISLIPNDDDKSVRYRILKIIK